MPKAYAVVTYRSVSDPQKLAAYAELAHRRHPLRGSRRIHGAAAASVAAAAAAASDKLKAARGQCAVFPVEDIERRQTDVEDFFLTEGELRNSRDCGLVKFREAEAGCDLSVRSLTFRTKYVAMEARYPLASARRNI